MTQHLHGARVCEHPTKKACEAARREARGRCTELVKSDRSGQTSCSNWAVERVNGRGVCGQHYEALLNREREAEARRRRQADLDKAINRYMAGEPRRIAVTQTWVAIQVIRGLLTP